MDETPNPFASPLPLPADVAATPELFEQSVAAADSQYRAPARSNAGVWLLVTMVLFALSNLGDFSWSRIAVLMGVLLFHEAGHYLGMQLFGYRDVRMFFIPFFGAAVSGKKHAAPPWQQLIVLLLGPLPGIIVGGILYAALRPSEFDSLAFQAVMMLIGLNAFNLLPLLPLDGGRIVHLLVFRRHPGVELVFRILTVAGLCALAILTWSVILSILAIILAIGIPLGYGQAKRARALRATWPSLRAIWPQLGDAEHRELFQHARALLPPDQNPKSIGLRMLNLHEAVSESSPGALATLGFLAIYLGAVFAVPVMLVIIGLDVRSRNPPQPAKVVQAEARLLSSFERDRLALRDVRRLDTE
jgi:Zn-dependent protease